MPKYINKYTNPVYANDTVFSPNQEVETINSIDNRAFVIGTVLETYAIVPGSDALLLRFNDETAWTTVALTNGPARTAAQIAIDINAAYGSTVASSEGGKVRIDAPVVTNVSSAIYIATVGMGSTAATLLGLATAAVNPVANISLQAFLLSQNAQTYNITTANNTFIFKVNNNSSWITATLTTGPARKASEIAADLNYAYEVATALTDRIAEASTPVLLGGATYVKLIAPVYNNFQSKLYIKSTGNTALTVLGFTGDNFEPVAHSHFPTLVKTSELPLYNPIISETKLTFGGAGTQYYYLIDPDECAELSFIRVSGGGGITFTCYIENILNTPPFTLAANETFGINLQRYRITRIVIVANMAGNLTIREIKG